MATTFTRSQPTNAATSVAAANLSRKTIVVQNVGTVDVYVGGSAVTTSTGTLLPASITGVVYSYTTTDSAALYGITTSGTGDLRVTEEA